MFARSLHTWPADDANVGFALFRGACDLRERAESKYCGSSCRKMWCSVATLGTCPRLNPQGRAHWVFARPHQSMEFKFLDTDAVAYKHASSVQMRVSSTPGRRS